MMTKRDYEALGKTMRIALKNSDRLRVYRYLCRSLGALNEDFDPDKFGASMSIPRLFRITKKTHLKEEHKNGSEEARQEVAREEAGGEEDEYTEEDFRKARSEAFERYERI